MFIIGKKSEYVYVMGIINQLLTLCSHDPDWFIFSCEDKVYNQPTT